MKKRMLVPEEQIFEGMHPCTAQTSVINDAQTVSAFGILGHLSKPSTDKQIEAAKREYMLKRYAMKMSFINTQQ